MENQGDSFTELFQEEEKKVVRRLTPGEQIKAYVASISGENIFLDIGGKSEGILDASELLDEEGNLPVQPGDVIEVYFLQVKNSEKIFTTKLGSGASVAHLEEAWRNYIPVEGHVEAEIKGGFEVTLPGNIRAFCPYSQMGLRRVEDPAATYVDTHMTFRITKFEENGRNLVLSARAILEEEREKQKEELKQSLEVGQTISGTISSIRDFGAFVAIGAVDGLIPLSEIGWSRVENINDHFTVGQEVTVVVKTIDWDKERISLSLKDTLDDPWDIFRKEFKPGSNHTGTVTRFAQFGAFVNLAENIDGLVHISKLGGGRRINHPRELLEVGQQIEVTIESIDDSSRRISLTPSDYQPQEERENKERKEYSEYLGEQKQDKNSDMGSLGAILKAKLEEKQKKKNN